jgi:predicted nucleotidyltransferase/predicted transcriptional regulator
MDVSKPFVSISPGVDADVLAVLAGSTQPRSGRELARRAERSNTGVRHVLDRLVEHGLVSREEVGRTFLYRLNRDHLLAPTVEQMVDVRAALVHRLRDAIGAWEIPPLHASMFGSAARGDGDARSDIDLLIVRPAEVDSDDAGWRGQIDGLADRVRRWTGNHAGIAEVSEPELPRLREDRPPVVEEVRKDAVDLFGESTRKLLGRL